MYRDQLHTVMLKKWHKKKKKTNGDYRRCSAGLCAFASGHPAPVVLSKYVQPASLSTLLQQSISFKGGMQIFVLTSYVHFVCNMSDVFFFPRRLTLSGPVARIVAFKKIAVAMLAVLGTSVPAVLVNRNA